MARSLKHTPREGNTKNLYQKQVNMANKNLLKKRNTRKTRYLRNFDKL